MSLVCSLLNVCSAYMFTRSMSLEMRLEHVGLDRCDVIDVCVRLWFFCCCLYMSILFEKCNVIEQNSEVVVALGGPTPY